MTGEGVAEGAEEPSPAVNVSKSDRDSKDAERCLALRVRVELYPLGLLCLPVRNVGGARLFEAAECLGAGGGLFSDGL